MKLLVNSFISIGLAAVLFSAVIPSELNAAESPAPGAEAGGTNVGEQPSVPAAAQPFIEASGRFVEAAQMALNIDAALLQRLREIDDLQKKIGDQQAQIQSLQQDIKNLDDTPLPPVTPPPPTGHGAGSGGGGSGDGGGSGGGGGDGGGLQAPQMAQLPQASEFKLPEMPQEVTPEFGDLSFGGGKEKGFTPTTPQFSPYQPKPLSLPNTTTPNTEASFGPAAIASAGVPKLKNLDPLSVPGAGATPAAGGDGAAGGAAGGGGAAGAMTAGGGGGGDGASLNGVGYEPPYDASSGIVVRDPGYGSGGGEGGSSGSSEGSGYGDSTDKASAKAIADQIYRGTASVKPGRFQRSRGDVAMENSIFGKLSNWIDDSCGFLEGSRSENRPPICDKAVANDLAIASADDADAYEGKATKVLNQRPESKPTETKPKLSPGVRELASDKTSEPIEPQAPDSTVKTDSVPATVPTRPASGKGAQEDLLSAVRAGFF